VQSPNKAVGIIKFVKNGPRILPINGPRILPINGPRILPIISPRIASVYI
jgi:hypothetical protein